MGVPHNGKINGSSSSACVISIYQVILSKEKSYYPNSGPYSIFIYGLLTVNQDDRGDPHLLLDAHLKYWWKII